MKHINIIKEFDLENWANTIDARSKLPQLIRRLIYGTTQLIQNIYFPSGEGIQRPGWDGILIAEQGNEYIPQGTSLWEFGNSSKY